MDVTTAQSAGDLAARIVARQNALVALQAAKDAGYCIAALRAVDPNTGREVSLILDRLDVPTSMQCFDFALSIYQSQLTDLSAQLTAL